MGLAVPVRARVVTASQRSTWSRATGARMAASPPNAASRCAAAIRQGSLMAMAPPGIRTGARCPARRNEVRSATRISPPHIDAVAAEAQPVEGDPDGRARLAVVGEAGGDVGVVVLDRRPAPRRPGRGRTWWRGTRGAGRGRPLRGCTSNTRMKCSMPSRVRLQGLVVLQVADVMGHERPAALGQAEGALQLRAAAEHRPGERPGPRSPAGGRTPASGAAGSPGPRTTRITESSVRMWMARSWVRKASAMPLQAFEGLVVAVGDGLVGEVAAGEDEGRPPGHGRAGGAAGL